MIGENHRLKSGTFERSYILPHFTLFVKSFL